MPFTKPDGTRDYDREAKWEKEKKPERAKQRAARMRNRRKLEKEGVVKKNDGKQVDHKKALADGGSNKRSNLKAVSAKKNLTKEAKRKTAEAKKK